MKTLQMFNSEYRLMLFPSSSFGGMEWWYFEHTSYERIHLTFSIIPGTFYTYQITVKK